MIFSDENLSSLQIRILISAINRATLRSLEEHFLAHKAPISHLQFGLMMTLRHQESTSSELSRMFGLDPSTLVPMVDSLVKKGYLERGIDPNDRRRTPLHITPEGHHLINEILNQFNHPPNDVLSASLRVMGEEKQAQLIALLRELASGLPEGDAMLKGMAERIDAYQQAGNTDRQCPQGNSDLGTSNP